MRQPFFQWLWPRICPWACLVWPFRYWPPYFVWKPQCQLESLAEAVRQVWQLWMTTTPDDCQMQICSYWVSPGLVAKSVLLRGALLVGPCWGFLGPSPCPCLRGPLCRLRRVPDPTIQYINIESYYNYLQPIEAGILQIYELTLKFGKELIPELSLADCCLWSSIIFFLNTGDCWKSSLCICNINTWLKCYWNFGIHIWCTHFICPLESRIQEYIRLYPPDKVLNYLGNNYAVSSYVTLKQWIKWSF